MKWPKDRKKAFLWAAKAFGTPFSKRTWDQRRLTSHGICRAIWLLNDSSKASYWVCTLGNKMRIAGVFWWPTRDVGFGWTPSCDNERSLFCCLMAALSDKEFEELAL